MEEYYILKTITKKSKDKLLFKKRIKNTFFEQCFFIIYFILALCLYIVFLPYLIYLSFKEKYKDSIPARFFLYKNSFFEKNDIWFHACSLGEVKSLKPILDRLDNEVNISVITNTGYDEAKKLSKEVRFLPFEIFQPFWQKKQKVLIVVEAELWYLLFLYAKKRTAKTILLNARISDNSYKSYKRFTFFYRFIFKHIDEVFAQSKKDKARLEELGAKDVKVTGNIKAFGNFKITKNIEKPKNCRIIVIASTHEKEEKLLLSQMKFQKNTKVIVVPRHPERFGQVDRFLKNFSKTKVLSYHKLSNKNNLYDDIILCDKMGELLNIYAISDIVILGGSFVDGIGGHNPLEPAYFNNIIISGKYIFNQKQLFKMIKHVYISDENALNKLLSQDLKKAYIKDKIELDQIIESIKNVV